MRCEPAKPVAPVINMRINTPPKIQPSLTARTDNQFPSNYNAERTITTLKMNRDYKEFAQLPPGIIMGVHPCRTTHDPCASCGEPATGRDYAFWE